MRRQLVRAALATSVAASLVAAAHPAAADPSPRFPRLDDAFNYTHEKPAILDGDRTVKVIIQVAGAPVGEARATAEEQGKSVSATDVRAEVKDAQAQVKQAVKDAGGTVLNSYTDSFNGIAARLPAKNLDTVSKAQGVVAVHAVQQVKPDNAKAVPYIGAPQAWQDLGRTGKGIKVAVVDTGVDYTHSTFGGSGNPADYTANNGTVIEPGTFPTAKVVAGYDFVGDAYDASNPAHEVPQPDPDPLDCNGHGSHVAGSAAGFGVNADGTTYRGVYDTTTHNQAFKVGPGVAPNASILAYRIFGCAGSADTSVIIAALDQAMKDGAQVVNMSLGSSFGRPDYPTVQAVSTLTRAGVSVVNSAGNSGASAYLVGAAAVAPEAIAVASVDAAMAVLPGVKIGALNAQVSNGEPAIPAGALPVAVLRTSYPSGPLSLGCAPADYAAYPGGVAGKLVITLRGTCARVKRAIVGQAAGAAAVAMIDTSLAYPPLEGPITADPDTGAPVNVTIPFLGINGADRAAASALDGQSTTLTPVQIPNPSYAKLASSSSAGPANVTSALKPDVTAPGVSVVSAGVGTGSGPSTKSGTSMATPMVAGVAALVREAHPKWKPNLVKAAIVSTADATTKIVGYTARIAGSGVVAARQAVSASVVGMSNLSFGYGALDGAYERTKTLVLRNTGSSKVVYDLAASFNGEAYGAQVRVSPSRVTIWPGDSREVDVTLSLAKDKVAALPESEKSNFGALTHIQGAVTATPTAVSEGVYPLRSAFLMVPDALSSVTASRASRFTGVEDALSTSVTVQNSGTHAGTAELFAWGISDADDVSGAEDQVDVRSVGVQSEAGPGADRTLLFALNVYGKWSNAAANRYEVAVDANADGTFDAVLVADDYGRVTTGDRDGRFAVFVEKLDGTVVAARAAVAPMNSGTMLLPALASEVGVTAAAPKFSYTVLAQTGNPDEISDTTDAAVFDAFTPAVSTGASAVVAPGASATVPLTASRAGLAAAPVKGWLAVTLNNKSGRREADEIPLPRLP
ncbi:S8 family serine peptidase [Nonomuraea sp. NPDC050556]|uniref:S8 family serine peptidase n=1 Tax=Nonomuraea sp. NPDC050556 TaxID=3364369 RepID=UPI0037ADC186